jgi:kinesin family member 1
VSGSSAEEVYDPKIPPERQKVTYQAKDGTLKTVTKAELQEQMETSEKLMQSLNETWEDKMQRTQEVQKEREKALEELGISVEKNNVGVHTPKKVRRFRLSVSPPGARRGEGGAEDGRGSLR